ncbi:MAG: TolC family protein [Bacteroidales bacterium]|nr:TolC family protein [Bacteroidales bacterium]
MKKTFLGVTLLLAALQLQAQTTLTLDDCRDMAVKTSKELEQARTAVEMAGYDRKIALANYFPNISAMGAYMYNNRDIALISEDQSQLLRGAGTLMQGGLDAAAGAAISEAGAALTQKMTQLMTAIKTNPALAQEYMGSPMWQTILNMLQGVDPSSLSGNVPQVADAVNALGADIDDALHPDLHHVWLGAVTVQQPVFAGGKIIYSNQMAALAETLAEAKYDMKYADVILDVDQAYWQIVSIAAKKQLAQSYSDLLHKMQDDVDLAVRTGVATESDALQIKVKANEADMLLTKSSNGLELAKMLLCKRVGLPLDTAIALADEGLAAIPVPVLGAEKSLEDIYADRPETRSLSLAKDIYDRKAKIVRADMLPRVALMGSYVLTNPNAFNGINRTWQGGMLSAGVMVSIPLFHGGEALNKYRKAKAEEKLYDAQYQDAESLINLQVAQQRKLFAEASEKLDMAGSNLESAEENLRKATVGFEAGVVETNTVLAAQTAWLSAHSEYIDAGIDLQMASSSLQKAEGNMTKNK